jgi:DNA polymerase III subunit gamma/tau
VGKTSGARVLAKALNCFHLSSDGEPCLTCQSCIEINEGRSVDVIEIDGASHRGIEKMREIKDNIQFLPSYSKYKIYIIDEVHMLTLEAFNAILKTLEEPPSHIVFIFATTEIYKVKNTIRSRCQQFFYKRLTVAQIAKHLASILVAYKVEFEKDALTLIAAAADGSMRDSQSILDQAIIYSDGKITVQKVKEILGSSKEETFLEFLDILIEENGKKMAAFIDNLYNEGIDFSFFLVELIEQMRALLLIKYEAHEFLHLPQFYIQELQKREGFFTKYQCHQMVELLMELFKDLKEADNEIFYLQATFMRLLEYKSFIHLADLIKRLKALEKGDVAKPLQEAESGEGEVKEFAPNSFVDKTQQKELNAPSLPLKEEQEKTPPLKPSLPTQESLTPTELLWQFKRHKTDPKIDNILSDIAQVHYELTTQNMTLEFHTQKYKDYFYSQKDLEKELLNFLKAHGLLVKKIEAFVQNANIKASQTKKELVQKVFNGQEIIWKDE